MIDITTAPVVLPASFTVRLDLLTAWGDSPSKPMLARLCAASVVLCIEHDEDPPKYDLAVADIHAFGAECLDWLVSKGVPPSKIYERGVPLVEAMSDSIPTEAEVDDAATAFPVAEE
jgi:hypothetical protein